MHDGIILDAAQDQSDRFAFAGLHHVFSRIVQVEVHLTGVGMGEFSDLEVNDDKTFEPAVEEQQVDAVPLITDANPFLSGNEGESRSELQEKPLELGR